MMLIFSLYSLRNLKKNAKTINVYVDIICFKKEFSSYFFLKLNFFNLGDFVFYSYQKLENMVPKYAKYSLIHEICSIM